MFRTTTVGWDFLNRNKHRSIESLKLDKTSKTSGLCLYMGLAAAVLHSWFTPVHKNAWDFSIYCSLHNSLSKLPTVWKSLGNTQRRFYAQNVVKDGDECAVVASGVGSWRLLHQHCWQQQRSAWSLEIPHPSLSPFHPLGIISIWGRIGERWQYQAC